MSLTKPPPVELTAILATLDDVGPNALTSCPEWTAHHIAAHVCGNYEEVRRHVEAFAEARPVDRTRTWEEREAPLRELRHSDLLHLIDSEASVVASGIEAVLQRIPDATLSWTGRTVPVAGFATHLRSENALHRWDLVGDDDTSTELLAQPELLVHAVRFIGLPLLGRGLSAGGGSEFFTSRIRSAGQEDLIIEAGDGEASISVGPVRDDATIEGDPSARLLMLWGRKPMPFSRLEMTDYGRAHVVSLVQALLAGY
jgi:hypothetical protein